jgi:hypothetical protein
MGRCSAVLQSEPPDRDFPSRPVAQSLRCGLAVRGPVDLPRLVAPRHGARLAVFTYQRAVIVGQYVRRGGKGGGRFRLSSRTL